MYSWRQKQGECLHVCVYLGEGEAYSHAGKCAVKSRRGQREMESQPCACPPAHHKEAEAPAKCNTEQTHSHWPLSFSIRVHWAPKNSVHP